MFCLQSAYLVGIADPASQPGRPGLVDQSQFARANQAIQMACSNLTNPASSQQQVKKKKKKTNASRYNIRNFILPGVSFELADACNNTCLSVGHTRNSCMNKNSFITRMHHLTKHTDVRVVTGCGRYYLWQKKKKIVPYKNQGYLCLRNSIDTVFL